MILYDELAEWWPLMSAPADYAEEAAFYRRQIVAASSITPTTMLELGSGGGNNASHLKHHFRMTLVDVAPEMLDVSREINPECEHLEGDMRTVRIGREFDCVFVHDAVCYMTSLDDLRQTMETAYVHCKPGGVALFAPDHTKENFRASTSHGGHDGESRGMRYLEWAWDPDPSDDTYVVDYAYLLRDANATTRILHERHVEGLFSQNDWLDLLNDVGFEPTIVPFEHSELPESQYHVFLGRMPLP